MEESPDLEAILRRVRKLLAIAEDARGDPNECAAAAAQAEKIMRKYQIDNAAVLLAGMQSAADFHSTTCGHGLDPFDKKAAFSRPAGIIAVAVAKLYDAQVMAHPGSFSFAFCGMRLDALLARYTYLMLLANMDARATIWKKREKANKQQHEAYLMGYAIEVAQLLREAKADKDAEGRRDQTFGALVVAKAALVRQHFGDPGYTPARGHWNDAAAAAGRAAGREADIGRKGVGATQHTAIGG